MNALLVIGNKKKLCSNSTEVYDFLINNDISVYLASDARCWYESASIDESYSEVDFDIYIV